MTCFITGILLLAAGCSGVPMRDGALDLDGMPAVPRQSSIQRTEPENITNSTSTDAEGSAQTGGGHHNGSVADDLALSASINEPGTHVGRGREGGGVVMMTKLETSTESPAVTKESIAELEIAAHSSEGSMSSTNSHNDLKVAPELILPLKSTSESPTLSKIVSESSPPLVTTKSLSSPPAISLESSAPLPASTGLSADKARDRGGGATVAAAPLPVAKTGERLASLSGEPLSPLAAPGPDELLVPLGGAGRSRHRPEPGLGPAEKKPSSRRTGVPELEMLENPSKARKGVPQPPEPGPTLTENKPSSRRTGVPDLEMLENPSKPRKGVSLPPPAAPAQVDAEVAPPRGTAVAGTVRPHVDAAYAGPEELAGEPESDPNLAKARTSMLVGVAFVALFILVLGWFLIRKISDSWHHRHYRKMDFLVDGMYNL